MIKEALGYLKKEAPILYASKKPITVLCLLVVLATWEVVSFFYSRQINNLESANTALESANTKCKQEAENNRTVISGQKSSSAAEPFTIFKMEGDGNKASLEGLKSTGPCPSLARMQGNNNQVEASGVDCDQVGE